MLSWAVMPRSLERDKQDASQLTAWAGILLGPEEGGNVFLFEQYDVPAQIVLLIVEPQIQQQKLTSKLQLDGITTHGPNLRL